jgi:hypothetical protein
MRQQYLSLLAMAIVFLAIIQYPYYLFERYDGSITIYQYDYYGNLVPIFNFANLQHLVGSIPPYQVGFPY